MEQKGQTSRHVIFSSFLPQDAALIRNEVSTNGEENRRKEDKRREQGVGRDWRKTGNRTENFSTLAW